MGLSTFSWGQTGSSFSNIVRRAGAWHLGSDLLSDPGLALAGLLVFLGIDISIPLSKRPEK